jgi:hypothetical protein
MKRPTGQLLLVECDDAVILLTPNALSVEDPFHFPEDLVVRSGSEIV